jgi:hypothetical protein
MRKYIYQAFTSILLFTSLLAFSQENKPVEMADAMRSNGKIYVVVAVIITLFTGIILYLISLDRKISKLEKETDKR